MVWAGDVDGRFGGGTSGDERVFCCFSWLVSRSTAPIIYFSFLFAQSAANTALSAKAGPTSTRKCVLCDNQPPTARDSARAPANIRESQLERAGKPHRSKASVGVSSPAMCPALPTQSCNEKRYTKLQPCGGQNREKGRKQSNEAREGHHNGPCHAMPCHVMSGALSMMHSVFCMLLPPRPMQSKATDCACSGACLMMQVERRAAWRMRVLVWLGMMMMMMSMMMMMIVIRLEGIRNGSTGQVRWARDQGCGGGGTSVGGRWWWNCLDSGQSPWADSVLREVSVWSFS